MNGTTAHKSLHFLKIKEVTDQKAGVYSELWQGSKMELLAKTVDS